MAMAKKRFGAIGGHISKAKYTRIERTRENQLIDNIVIAIYAVICGAESWVNLDNFGKRKKK